MTLMTPTPPSELQKIKEKIAEEKIELPRDFVALYLLTRMNDSPYYFGESNQDMHGDDLAFTECLFYADEKAQHVFTPMQAAIGQVSHISKWKWRRHLALTSGIYNAGITTHFPGLIGNSSMAAMFTKLDSRTRGVAIFAKAFMGIPAQQAAKTTRPLMPAAAPAVLLLSLNTQQGVFNFILAMTRRDFGKPAFSLRKKTLRENTCPIASGDYSTPVSQRWKPWIKLEKRLIKLKRNYLLLHQMTGTTIGMDI